jgi:hypothetical protein
MNILAGLTYKSQPCLAQLLSSHTNDQQKPLGAGIKCTVYCAKTQNLKE